MKQYQNCSLILCKTVNKTLYEKEALSFGGLGTSALFHSECPYVLRFGKIYYTAHHH